jgi:hypothetical protein
MATLAQLHTDVLIVGGGSAGVAAAVAAARSGADVILIERLGFFGGKATAANVGTICGLYYTSHNPRSRYVTGEFPQEFAERIIARSGTRPTCNRRGLHFLPYRPFDFSRVCDQLLSESGVRLFLHTGIAALSADSGISSVSAISLDRSISIAPHAVVDCSGEALCTTLSGREPMTGHAYQAASQTFSLSGVSASSEESLGIAVIRHLQEAVADGSIAQSLSRVSVVPGSLIQGQARFKVTVPMQVDDAPNRATALELAGRDLVERVFPALIKRVPALSHAQLCEVASEVGMRTGRRCQGRALLTRRDVIGSSKCDDSVARGSWPMEKWGPDGRVVFESITTDDYYDVPSGCLVSAAFDNLFFGGRHICADEDAIASARVIGTCLSTGYAAGSLAARSPGSNRRPHLV